MTPPFEIAPATAEDALGVYAVLAAAFGGNIEPDLVVSLYREDAVVLTLAARLDGLVVGACVFSRVRLKSGSGVKPAVCLAPIGVAPALQKSGIGSALIVEGLTRLEAKGETLVLVLGDPSYYGRFGFSTAAAASIKTPWDGPYQQALVLSGPHPGPCDAIYADAFGAFE